MPSTDDTLIGLHLNEIDAIAKDAAQSILEVICPALRDGAAEAAWTFQKDHPEIGDEQMEEILDAFRWRVFTHVKRRAAELAQGWRAAR